MEKLSATSLLKRYSKRTVVKDVSIDVERGEVVGLLGPNGAGKTTSFYMIVGLVPVDGGRVMLGDRDITQMPIHRRANLGIGYLSQEPSVFRRMSVEDNLLAILELRPELEKRQRRDICTTLLRQFGLSKLRDNLAMSLSGGERRRLEIARSLTMEPSYILLDEPFAGIDPISVTDIQAIIGELSAEGIGILITDHNVRETLGICDRAYIINSGEVLAHGEPQLVLDNPDVREVYLGHAVHMSPQCTVTAWDRSQRACAAVRRKHARKFQQWRSADSGSMGISRVGLCCTPPILCY